MRPTKAIESMQWIDAHSLGLRLRQLITVTKIFDHKTECLSLEFYILLQNVTKNARMNMKLAHGKVSIFTILN